MKGFRCPEILQNKNYEKFIYHFHRNLFANFLC